MEADSASPSSAHIRAIEGFDDYGFAIFAPGQQPDTERCHVYKCSSFTQEQLSAWKKLLGEWDDSTTSGSSRLHTSIRRGVPREFRPQLWKKLLETETLRLCNKFNYKAELEDVREQLVELGISEFGGADGASTLSEVESDQYHVRFDQISLDALRHIMLDLERTYPTHRMFMNRTSEGKEGKATLFRVLATYARYNKSVEYCQGMSAIAGMFLMYMEEEDAFWCMVSLLERQKYLAGYFNEEMARLKIHSLVFEKLLYQRFPEMQKHLENVGVNSLMYITPWFLCLFTNLVCWDVVLAVWDLLLLEGYKAMFRVGISIMDSYHRDLLNIPDISSMLPKLLHLPVDVVNYIKLTPKIYSTCVEDWEVNCLMSVIEQEQRLSPNTPCGGPKKLNATPKRSVAKKRKPSDDDKLVFQFKGRDRHKNKRIKEDMIDGSVATKSSPSLFTRFTRMFQRQQVKNTPGTPIDRKSFRRKSNSRRKSGTPVHHTPRSGKFRNSARKKSITGTPKACRTPLRTANLNLEDMQCSTPPMRGRNRGGDDDVTMSTTPGCNNPSVVITSACGSGDNSYLTDSSGGFKKENLFPCIDDEINFKSFVSGKEKGILSSCNTPNRHLMSSPDLELKPLCRQFRPV